MKYLVTGAGGWFGGWIVPYLKTRGYEVFEESSQRPPPEGVFDRIVHLSRGRAAPWTKYLAPGGRMVICSSGSVLMNKSEYSLGKLEDEAVKGVRIARCYAFLGHGSPDRYAAGKFIKMAKAQQPIIVTSWGTTIRSYMYMTDLVERLLMILEEGEPNTPYEVGSNRPVTLLELAYRISETVRPNVEVIVQGGPPAEMPIYLPTTPFGGDPRIGLNEAIWRAVHE
jgi:nucleoside-diphosphate-sugar epimerase